MQHSLSWFIVGLAAALFGAAAHGAPPTCRVTLSIDREDRDEFPDEVHEGACPISAELTRTVTGDPMVPEEGTSSGALLAAYDVASLAGSSATAGDGDVHSIATAANPDPSAIQCRVTGPPAASVSGRLRVEASALMTTTRTGCFTNCTFGPNSCPGFHTCTLSTAAIFFSFSLGPAVLIGSAAMHGEEEGDPGPDYSGFLDGLFTLGTVTGPGTYTLPAQIYLSAAANFPVGTDFDGPDASMSVIAVTDDTTASNTATTFFSASLPSDGSDVLLLPAGYSLDCDEGLVVKNAWTGTPVEIGEVLPGISPVGWLILTAVIGGMGTMASWARRRHQT